MKYVVVALALLFASPAVAKPCVDTDVMRPVCGTTMVVSKPERAIRHAASRSWEMMTQTAVILPHPPGCPARAFCGCGAAVEVFGRPIRGLWLAANWLRYPQAAPAPGMVAARRGHVFVIKQVLGDGRVLAYDANSGGRKTRLHARSLAGFVVVNPHG